MSYQYESSSTNRQLQVDVVKPLFIMLGLTLCLLGILAVVFNNLYPWNAIYPGTTTLAQIEQQWGKPIEVISVHGGGKTHVYSHRRLTGLAKYKHIYVYTLDDSPTVQVVSLMPYHMTLAEFHKVYGTSFGIGIDQAGIQYMLDSEHGVFAEYHDGQIDFLCIYNTEWVFKEGWHGPRQVSDQTELEENVP